MGAKNKSKRLESEEKKMLSKKEKAREHMEQLHRLQEKDPEFYQFLKEHDKELLEFNDEEVDDEVETDVDDDEEVRQEEEEEEDDDDDLRQPEDLSDVAFQQESSSKNVITSEMVDSWCKSVRDNASLSALRSLMQAFRTSCHYGDDDGDDSGAKFSIISSNVFNKIMLFVLKEMDGILRGLLKLPSSGGNKDAVMNLASTKQWKNYNHFVKSYLGNALHVLNQMTDTEMISFTLRRLRFSAIFLAAFPVLLRKYIKVILHFWGTGGGALPIVSFLFLRDLSMQLGADCIDDGIKGMYKAYVQSCQYVNATKLQHIQFLGNCFTELLRVNLPAAYQHAFVFIRQLAMILSQAMTDKKKESFRKVYEWKYINCLELWTAAICAYGSEADFRPLAYPLTQIISGAACLTPTAQYFPLRLRCARMLNRIAASTGTFIPVSSLLLDMLEMKELHTPPTGGVGKAVDLRTVLKVSKPALKTRAFQEACVFSVVEELTEHLAQWSYSVTFFELSFVPTVRLRNFCKSTEMKKFYRKSAEVKKSNRKSAGVKKFDRKSAEVKKSYHKSAGVKRFCSEIRRLIRQIEANCEFTNKKRISVTVLPNDPAAADILEEEKKSGTSPLSQYAATLRKRAEQRNASFTESMLVGEESSVFGKEIIEDDENDDNVDEEGAAAFSSSWLPQRDAKDKQAKEEKRKKRKKDPQQDAASDEDLVEDLILSDDEEDDSKDLKSFVEDFKSEQVSRQHGQKPKPKPKLSADPSKMKMKHRKQKSKKRKREN